MKFDATEVVALINVTCDKIKKFKEEVIVFGKTELDKLKISLVLSRFNTWAVEVIADLTTKIEMCDDYIALALSEGYGYYNKELSVIVFLLEGLKSLKQEITSTNCITLDAVENFKPAI